MRQVSYSAFENLGPTVQNFFAPSTWLKVLCIAGLVSFLLLTKRPIAVTDYDYELCPSNEIFP
jgi:hypothetical protein